jgi:hypothetical protein
MKGKGTTMVAISAVIDNPHFPRTPDERIALYRQLRQEIAEWRDDLRRKHVWGEEFARECLEDALQWLEAFRQRELDRLRFICRNMGRKATAKLTHSAGGYGVE